MPVLIHWALLQSTGTRVAQQVMVQDMYTDRHAALPFLLQRASILA